MVRAVTKTRVVRFTGLPPWIASGRLLRPEAGGLALSVLRTVYSQPCR